MSNEMMAEIGKIFEKSKITVKGVSSMEDYDVAKSKILGPNGILRELMKAMPTLPREERPIAGQAINACKNEIEEIFRERLEAIEKENAELSLGPSIDPTLSKIGDGEITCHPLTMVRNRMIEIFSKLGFVSVEGSEIETEWFCFDALNTSQGHPSREESDTFYFAGDTAIGNVSKRTNELYLLRTQTSTVQIRTMLETKPPIRVLSPGRVFRKDTMDATHSPNFHQCEGLVVEEGTSVCDLKATLDFFFTELIGEGCEIRMRPSYFPFVSPGFEVDFKSKALGKLSDRWIEAVGCGMVAPNVLRNCGCEDSGVSGFAFGMGIERLAMLLFGIDDIRLFFQNDVRVLGQFRRSML
jgi:phenylalanyl-tRNA synthetase alpha chain